MKQNEEARTIVRLTHPKKIRLEKHHIAWLNCHTDRTAQWLADRLADNFHVHHVDGDHKNDAPDNLALIEGLDHMLLFHGMRNYAPNKVAGRLGGLAMVKKYSREQRSIWARRGARKRWSTVRKAKRDAAKAVAAANRAKRQGIAHKAANAEKRV